MAESCGKNGRRWSPTIDFPILPQHMLSSVETTMKMESQEHILAQEEQALMDPIVNGL